MVLLKKSSSLTSLFSLQTVFDFFVIVWRHSPLKSATTQILQRWIEFHLCSLKQHLQEFFFPNPQTSNCFVTLLIKNTNFIFQTKTFESFIQSNHFPQRQDASELYKISFSFLVVSSISPPFLMLQQLSTANSQNPQQTELS